MRNSGITSEERLEHIVKAISDIETFIMGNTKDSYLGNDVLINATLFQFAIIGKAIMYVDNAILSKYNYPWHKVRGFKNFIVHEYHAIEFRIVWESIKNDLPELKKIIQTILKKEFNNTK